MAGDPQSADARTRAEEIARGLFPHQVEGLAFLLGRRRSILADDMGLGKTRQSIHGLTQAAPGGPWLVVCPASVKRNWEREILAVHPGARTCVAGPDPPPEPGYDGWVIVNYDILGKHVDELLAHGWSGLVFDEAHYLKNHRSIRSRLSTRLVSECPGDPVVHALTGTPLTNRPRDLFPLLKLVDHSLGRSFLGFARRYCDAHRNEHGHWITSGASRLDELAVQLHGIMLRRTKDEVVDLPPKIRTWIEVDVPQRVVDELGDLARRFLDPDLERMSFGGRRGRNEFSSARRQLAEAKAASTLEYLRGAVDQGEKALVYSGFAEPVRRFARHFGEQAVVVSGDVPAARRQELVDRFQEDEGVRLFVGQLHAAGTGINLTAARLVVFNDLDWVPANHWQAEDRAHRIGQTGTVNVAYMVARGTIEEFIRGLLEAKARLVDDVVEGRSLGEDAGGDVLVELRRALAGLRRRLGTLDPERLSAGELQELLREAGQEYAAGQDPAADPSAMGRLAPVSEKAVRALAAVLGGPRRLVFRVASSTRAGLHYRVEAVGTDVICECKGFSYRGACAHARDLKDALVSGRPLPPSFEPVP